MSTPENKQSSTPPDIDLQVKSLLNEMHELLNQSKTNPSPETSQKLVECFHKMDTLQKEIKKQLGNLHSED